MARSQTKWAILRNCRIKAAKGWGDETQADVLKRVRDALQRVQKNRPDINGPLLPFALFVAKFGFEPKVTDAALCPNGG